MYDNILNFYLGATVAQLHTCLPAQRSGFSSWSDLKVGKLVVACWQFTVQNLDQLYVLVSSAHKTTRHHITCVESDVKLQNK